MTTRVNVGKEIDVEVQETKDVNLIIEMTRSRIVSFAMAVTVVAVPSAGVASYMQGDQTYLLATAGAFSVFWTSIAGYYFGKKKGRSRCSA